jgi:membrane protein DedA with SNARE-associated domain
MRLGRFLAIDILSAAVTRGICIYLGYRLGQPAVDVVQVIATYSWWISIALLTGILASALRRAWLARRAQAYPSQPKNSG